MTPDDSAGVGRIAPEVDLEPLAIFKDKIYTSRTLVMKDGRTISVAKGVARALLDDEVSFLKAREDFQPLQEG